MVPRPGRSAEPELPYPVPNLWEASYLIIFARHSAWLMGPIVNTLCTYADDLAGLAARHVC